jgi:ribosomal protein S18 acetylase RimI-like enzyme
VPNGIVATKTDRKILVKHLGFIKGNILHYAVLINNKFPFAVDDKTGIIEILATHENHRGKGIGTALMKHVFDIHSYNTYILEVVDTNEAAIKMYEKIGFKEITRKKSPFPNSPHKYSVYMRCVGKSKG